VLIDIGVQTWLGYPFKVLGIHSKDSQIHLFLHLSHDLSYISTFFLMSNEIILFQILYSHLKYLLFSLMKVKIVKFIQCGPCSINGQKFLEIWFFGTFYIAIGHWFLSHSCILYTLTCKVLVVKILGQKKLFIHSLWVLELFFLMKQNHYNNKRLFCDPHIIANNKERSF
jgi:hypothetical protein